LNFVQSARHRIFGAASVSAPWSITLSCEA
jgi:hypothetical protein